MRKILRRLLLPAMVVACIALAFALDGMSPVGPQKLQNSAATTRTVKDGTLTGAKIVASTLAKGPLAVKADAAENAALAGGNTVKRFLTVVLPEEPRRLTACMRAEQC